MAGTLLPLLVLLAALAASLASLAGGGFKDCEPNPPRRPRSR